MKSTLMKLTEFAVFPLIAAFTLITLAVTFCGMWVWLLFQEDEA